jgi:hypothetical protein
MFSLIELTYCIYILLQRELQFILEKKKKNYYRITYILKRRLQSCNFYIIMLKKRDIAIIIMIRGE